MISCFRNIKPSSLAGKAKIFLQVSEQLKIRSMIAGLGAGKHLRPLLLLFISKLIIVTELTTVTELTIVNEL